MTESTPMIDVFCHALPPKYTEHACRVTQNGVRMLERARSNKTMVDLETRFRIMDEFPGYRQIVSLSSPPVETLGPPEVAANLARVANDELAEIVARHPDRFDGFVATLPLNAPEAAMAEAQRAMTTLGARGVQLFTNVGGKPLDTPETMPLIDQIGQWGYPTWLHPARGMQMPDYAGEEVSRYELWWLLGWPLETALAMARLTYAGLFDRWPDLVVITHHAGGLLPMVAGRIQNGGFPGGRTPPDKQWATETTLSEPPPQAMRRFHADTATFGSAASMACGLDFFGASRMFFATDMPFGPEGGKIIMRDTVRALESLNLSDADREAILHGNAERLLRPQVSASLPQA